MINQPLCTEYNLQFQIARLQTQVTKLRVEIAELRAELFTDGLTRIPSRFAFDQAILREYQRCQYQRQPLALGMVDIDYFKEFNDVYGCLAGDKRLIQLARAIATIPKYPRSLVARYRGEEFAFMLPSVSHKEASAIAGEMLTTARTIGSTISIGLVVEVPRHADSAYTMLSKTCEALTQAKQQGRNQLAVWTGRGETERYRSRFFALKK